MEIEEGKGKGGCEKGDGEGGEQEDGPDEKVNETEASKIPKTY